MSPSPNSATTVLIANPGNRRVNMFGAALQSRGLPPARLVTYADLIAGRIHLADVVRTGDFVRIDSPEKDFTVEQAILASGADVPDPEGDFARISPAEIATRQFDKGAILFPRQWYRGYCAVLEQIAAQLADCPPHRLFSAPADIATMFDKPRCHALFSTNGLAVPRSPGPVRSYDELVEKMNTAGMPRVFVKLAHGSSASGVVAYGTMRGQHQATSTVEMVDTPDGPILYNSRRIRTYTDQGEIARLIDALCRHRVHVEKWLPKAGFRGQTFDLRVLVIGGSVRHVVVRLSNTPLTNLHLSNGRTTLDDLLTRLPAPTWAAARATCESAKAIFPNSLYAGIDLLILSDYRHHAIAEINAFGDLLLGAQHEGRYPYETELDELRA